MKHKHSVYELIKIAACVPSTDYYAKEGDWTADDVTILEPLGEFDTAEEAKRFIDDMEEGIEPRTYTILPTFTK